MHFTDVANLFYTKNKQDTNQNKHITQIWVCTILIYMTQNM